MSNLSDLVPSLQRALATPGTFADLFPDTTTTDLVGVLTDAMAEAQLDGFLGSKSLDVRNAATSPDLTVPEQALVVLYGMSRVVTARVSNLKNRARYKAGAVESETEQSATVLVELLKEIRDRKKQLLDDAKAGHLAKAFGMVDMYIAKSVDLSDPNVDYLAMSPLLVEPGNFGR